MSILPDGRYQRCICLKGGVETDVDYDIRVRALKSSAAAVLVSKVVPAYMGGEAAMKKFIEIILKGGGLIPALP